ncbi:RNA polymerase sigma factor [Flavivirga jejuensis]|uniref:Sigma-70 family RNA polymerase sigma factor n=1 Tax=Flavivirga jejuensis TaxID=870487 RepID=A0ABT8WQU5_9FLAO|nr:sigma-70 family RNA polymerase sigma factor [Flavivirga jejuensis]MDO5975530.1 sigma-70 family RNA polymerase sigma factor [Flavivirga jejuensis]
MSFPYINNVEFIESLKKGNENAYTYLVKTYHKPLFIYALSLTNDHAQSEDIVQTVFLKSWEFRKRLNPDYSIKSFLYKTTYNEFINQYHQTRAISNLEKVYIEAIDETVDSSNSELLEQKIALVTEGIKNLPKKCKETFLLSRKDGLTNMEISDYLNISIKTVEGHITKAFSILRKTASGKIEGILFFLYRKRHVNT